MARVYIWHGRVAWEPADWAPTPQRPHTNVPVLSDKTALAVRLWRHTLVRWRESKAKGARARELEGQQVLF